MTPELIKRITFHLKWYFEIRLNTDHEIVRKAVKNELRKIMRGTDPHVVKLVLVGS